MVQEASNTAVRELAVRAAEASEAGSGLRKQVALMLRDQGKYPEARAMLEGVVAAREAAESAGEGKVEDTLVAKGRLGEIMEMQGELDAAMDHLSKALSIQACELSDLLMACQ